MFRDPSGLDPEWDEQVWRAQQDLIEAVAPGLEYGIGFGDTLLFGFPRWLRNKQGIETEGLDCSVWYQAGGWTAITFQVAEGGVGIYRGGLAISGAIARRNARNFFNGASYSPKVYAQMAKGTDIRHAFPESVAGYATRYGRYSVERGADGKKYYWLRMEGSYKGQSGVFEFIKDQNGVINHRYLRPYGN